MWMGIESWICILNTRKGSNKQANSVRKARGLTERAVAARKAPLLDLSLLLGPSRAPRQYYTNYIIKSTVQ